MNSFRVVLAVLCIAGCSSQISHNSSSPDITGQELREHIQILTSADFAGRRAGEEGNRKAARYIAGEFERYGLAPAGDEGSYFQNFTFVASSKIGQENALRVTTDGAVKNFVLNEQYRPVSISADSSVSAPLVFAGYGITLRDSQPYDDYAGIDVKGKVVVVLRYSPEGPTSQRFGQATALMAKVSGAQAHGAAAIVLLSAPPDSTGASPLIKFDYQERVTSGIPVVTMRWTDFDTLMHAEGSPLADLQGAINAMRKPRSMLLTHSTASLRTQIDKIYANSANIAGFLEGTDPELKGEVLIVGAHMDHLGMGGEGSLKPDTVAIHPGADDNASGSAGLLELAQYLSARRASLKRSVLFLSFSGEEMGLLGSAHYTAHPLLPLTKTIAMINMDMIGRMKDSVLVVEGMGTSAGFTDIVKRDNRDSLDLRLKPDGYGPSDHASFYAKDLPVMFFFTSLHPDYHRPSDTWDKINYSGEEKVVRLVSRVAQDLADAKEKPAFTKVIASGPAMGGDRQGVRATLGLVPDYSGTGPGLRITGTRPGSPADKAGLKAEDTIIRLGEKTITNIYDYMYALEQYKPGDKVTVVVKRGANEVTMTATLEARP